jgi:DNA-binding MarR family transcriptional regulator
MISESLVFRAPDPDDRRRVLILLAPAGKALYKRLRKVSSAQEQRLASSFGKGRRTNCEICFVDWLVLTETHPSGR